MQVRYILTMVNAVVDGKRYDQLTLEWIGELPRIPLIRIPKHWVHTSPYLLTKMEGLTSLDDSSLEIQTVL